MSSGKGALKPTFYETWPLQLEAYRQAILVEAARKQPADFSVQLVDDWLLVCNNGRKVTARNLLGLSRFFVHFGSEEIHQLDDDTIGRFGIGFKSCYRIARQVLIETWDSRSTFAFRLPICSDDDGESHPDQKRLDRLVQLLAQQGARISNSLLRRREGLGYCTPEFLGGLPKPLSDLAASIEKEKRGSLFCLHLHKRGLEEVERHLSGGIDDLYRLCPLFLPNMRSVTLGSFRMEKSVPGGGSAGNATPGVAAKRVTLTVTSPEGRKNHRFWRLAGDGVGDCWQIALAAVPAVTREIVLWNTNYVTAPTWLDTTALDLIDSRRLLGRQTSIELVTAASLQNRQKRELIAKELLGRTHEWADRVATDDQLRALNELFREATGNWTIGINSKRDEVLRSVVAVPGGVEDQDFAGGTEHWNGKDRLPRQLMRVENLTRVCIRLENVKRIVVPEGDIVPIPVGDASAVLRSDARFLTLLSKGNLRYCRKIHVRWCREDQTICEWRDVDYARDDDGLLVSRVERQPDVTGYSDVLAFYLRYSNDASVQAEREKGESPVAIYGRHRKRILSVFRRELVERVG